MYLLHLLLFIHSLRDYILFKLTNVACEEDFKNTYNYTTFTTISSEKTQRKTNKQLAPYFCSIFFRWCEFFPAKTKNRFFDDVRFFSPERRMQNSCRGFVTAGNPDKSAPYAGAFVS